MSELIQPLTSAPTEAKTTSAANVEPQEAPSFPELVYARFDWWRELRNGTLTHRTRLEFERSYAAFQRTHGQVIKAYWCSNVESAVVLTERKGRLPWASPRCGFHRESDCATLEWPEIAAELHRCDELAVKAQTVLTGVRRRICMDLVVASAAHLMSVVDRRANDDDKESTAAVLDEERKALARTEKYYRTAANGQAQIVYFAGMALVAAVISLVAAIWLSVTWASPVAALVAGAIGAVVSVVQRINSGKFELDYDVGRPYALFLGGLRPLIGGAFALAISFAFTGGLLHLPVSVGEPDSDRRLALLVISFLAGFSERWAQDALVAAVPVGESKQAVPASAAAPVEGPGASPVD